MRLRLETALTTCRHWSAGRNLGRTFIQHRSKVTVPAVQPKHEENEAPPELRKNILRPQYNLPPKPKSWQQIPTLMKSGVKVQREPFIKNLFVGKFDTDLLTYPEMLEPDQISDINAMADNIDKFFKEKVDSNEIDRNSEIPPDVMKGLKDLGVFGLQIPLEYGGLDLNSTQYARIAESTAIDGAIAVMLAAHQAIGLKGILMFGTEKQKKTYLPRLARGEHVAAFCLTEPSTGSDAASIQTTATLTKDGRYYLLNGTKIYISNGGIADIFTVFAKTTHTSHGRTEDTVSAFIVERAFGGITNGTPESKMGIRGSNTCSVIFEDTLVPVENLLGSEDDGFKTAMNVLNSGRFSMGSSGAAILKHLSGLAVEHTIQRQQFDKPLKDFQIIQEKITAVSLNIYAMESMAYLTAALIDSQVKPDCAVEAAIVKVFSSEAVFRSANECLQIMGGSGYMTGLPFERAVRDMRILTIFEGTNEILRLFIALNGVQHAGKSLTDMVRKLRNPFFHPTYAFKMVWQRNFQSYDNPKLYMRLGDFLHPSLHDCSEQLEKCVVRLKQVVEVVLKRWAKDIVNQQLELKRLADIVIKIYAMTACLSRASRSYCIGLNNADIEMNLAITFNRQCYNEIDILMREALMGPIENNDELKLLIAEKIIESKGYCVEHPITRNWN